MAFAASLCVSATPTAAQTPQSSSSQTPSSSSSSQQVADIAGDTSRLTEDERRLVASSRAAIISTGLPAHNFDRHFTVVRVVNTAGDRRVLWRLRAGEHEAFVADSIGFYIDGKGRRINTHSVLGTLGSTRQIGRTITRRRAEQLMRTCIGPFNDGSVIYQPAGTPPRAALFFSATATPPAPAQPAQGQPSKPGQTGQTGQPSNPGQPAGQTQGSQPAPPVAAGQESDRLRTGGKKPPPPLIGFVDLQTGRCTVGYGLAGAYPPLPPAARPRKRRN